MTKEIKCFIFGPSLHILYFSHSHCYTSSESQKAQVPRSLTDAVKKHNKDKKESIPNAGSDKTGKGVDSKVKKDEKSTKTFKKKTDGEKKFRKEAKVPMTPAERRASKPNFALVRLLSSLLCQSNLSSFLTLLSTPLFALSPPALGTLPFLG